ncbi:NAD(P)-binding protein [Hesseltinella vesiculosa]|uniref:NAD(P)-binding protein n=1 Tax=Hesseltinella vesiculosa TaxID=101127 RepID=A0A1X2GV81_9FUNG|nr:NAD(P)-binding protein [Hesseltinella vesiculosa]
MTRSQTFEVVGLAYSRSGVNLVKIDLLDEDASIQFLKAQAPQVIVHCAAERRPDQAAKDPEGTLVLNAKVPGYLATYCKAQGILLIYISTDYVFDGKNPPYQVDAQTGPLNFYGESKLAGEEAIRQVDPQAIILRVPILYGDVEYNGESAVNILIDAVKNTSKECLMDHYCLRFPTNVIDIGRVILDIAVHRVENGQPLAGTYHFTAEEMYTKYEMCQVFAEVLKVPMDHLLPQTEVDTSAAAARPKDCHLSTQRLKEAGINLSFVPFKTWFQAYLQ